MKIAVLPLVALLSLPGAARAEVSAEPELPTPAANDDAKARVDDELGDDAPGDDAVGDDAVGDDGLGDDDEAPRPHDAAPPERAGTEPRTRSRARDDDEDERPKLRTNEYGLPVPGEDAIQVRLVPELAGTSVRLVSRAEGIKKHEGILCDKPCTVTIEPGDYGVQVWKDGHKLHGRRLRILESEEIIVGPANRPLAYAGLVTGIVGVVGIYAGLVVGEFFIGAHGDGGSAGGTRADMGLGLVLGGVALASVGFPVFISKFRASVDEEPLGEADGAQRPASRAFADSVSKTPLGLSVGFQF